MSCLGSAKRGACLGKILLSLLVLAVAARLLLCKECAEKPDAILRGHQHWVQAVAFAPDGKTLVSTGGDFSRAAEALLWDVPTRRPRGALDGLTSLVTCLAFAPDGGMLAAAGYDTTVQLRDLSGVREPVTLRGHGRPVHSVAFSSDGAWVASGSYCEDGVRLWGAVSGRLCRTLPGRAPVAFAPRRAVLAGTGAGPDVVLWDVATGAERGRIPGQTLQFTALAFSPDGRCLAAADFEGTIHLCEVAGPQVRSVLEGHDDRVLSLAFSPDGTLLASGGMDRSVRLWDLSTGEERRRLVGHEGPVNSIAFSPDGKLLASGSWDKTVRLWRVGR
jgi:WD40 repeat protein